MHRLSAAARRTLVIALGSLTLLFAVLNFGVFLMNTHFSPWHCQLKERVEVVSIQKPEAAARAEFERQRVDEEMARVKLEIQRLNDELRSLEVDRVHRALDAAGDAMSRREMHLKPPALPTTLTREGTLHIQFDASDVQLN